MELDAAAVLAKPSSMVVCPVSLSNLDMSIARSFSVPTSIGNSISLPPIVSLAGEASTLGEPIVALMKSSAAQVFFQRSLKKGVQIC